MEIFGKKNIGTSIVTSVLVLFIILKSNLEWYFIVGIPLVTFIVVYFFGIIRFLFGLISLILGGIFDSWIDSFDAD